MRATLSIALMIAAFGGQSGPVDADTVKPPPSAASAGVSGKLTVDSCASICESGEAKILTAAEKELFNSCAAHLMCIGGHSVVPLAAKPPASDLPFKIRDFLQWYEEKKA